MVGAPELSLASMQKVPTATSEEYLEDRLLRYDVSSIRVEAVKKKKTEKPETYKRMNGRVV